MRKKIEFTILYIALMLVTGVKAFSQTYQKTNVLFIIVDDLRPMLGCYGDSIAITPNIDKLASRGTVFKRAYCQEAVCNPSRASIMTGLRPNTTKVWDLKTHFREALPHVITLPQWFKQHGYRTQSIGKIYHDPAALKDPISWSVPETMGVTTKFGKYVLDSNLAQEHGWKSTATERANAPSVAYIDGMVNDAAIQILNKIKDKPFFLAVGYRRPHLPFSAPEQFWALYDRKKLPMPVNPKPPVNVPRLALTNSRELRGYTDVPDSGAISYDETQKLLHGYYASISFVDSLVGRLLHELDQLGLTKNTAIVFVSDHGYHLGEEGLWGKCTDFEAGTRVPLIIASPSQKQKGTKTNALVELVDIYPTLTDVSGLAIPKGLEGISIKPLLDNPDITWKKAAFSQFPRPWPYKKEPKIMGYTVRTNNFRYTEWQDFKTGKIKARELYDHRNDSLETDNVVSKKKYQHQVKKLHQLLHDGWKSCLPKK